MPSGTSETVPLDNEEIILCLDEAERELLRIGEQDCGYFYDDTQLKAVVLLLLRCASLIRSMLVLLLGLEKVDDLKEAGGGCKVARQ